MEYKIIKRLMVISFIILFIVIPAMAVMYESHYIRHGEVIQSDSGYVLIKDTTNNVWEAVLTDEIPTGTFVEMVMNDNHTTSIYDDTIIRINR